MTEDKLRKRIAELEDGLNELRISCGTLLYEYDAGAVDDQTLQDCDDKCARAASLLEQKETPVEEAGGPLYRSAHGVAVSVIEAINAKAGRLMDDETLTDLIRDAIELELDVNALNASPEDSVLLRAEKNPAPAQEAGVGIGRGHAGHADRPFDQPVEGGTIDLAR